MKDSNTIHDRDIREPLFEYLEDNYGKVRIFEEKRMGNSRADVVMVTEQSVIGIEIKSDADTYVRLERQIPDYCQYFDKNIIVVGSTHAKNVEKHVPDEWGIISVEEIEGQLDFYEIRGPRHNDSYDMKKKLSILWRPELAAIQEKNDMHAYKNKSKAFVIEKIESVVETETLNRQISDELFERDYSTIAEVINEYRVANNQKKRRRTMKKKKKYKKLF